MSFKTVIVHCDADERLPARLRVAVDVAGRFASHLVGVHVRPPFRPPVVSDGTIAVGMDDFFRLYQQCADSDMKKAESAFAQAVKQSKCPFEWRVTDDDIDHGLVVQSRYADLVIVGQDDPKVVTNAPPDLGAFVALASGRPLLLLPRAGVVKTPGANVMLCWNESRESARAASDALPFLKAAGHVSALIVEPGKRDTEAGGRAADRLETWLGRHGVSAIAHRDSGSQRDVGNVILSRAADLDADLIVMGLYGHSRTREFVLGGASRTILSGTTVPVLLAH